MRSTARVNSSPLQAGPGARSRRAARAGRRRPDGGLPVKSLVASPAGAMAPLLGFLLPVAKGVEQTFRLLPLHPLLLRGRRIGGALIASHHANLFVNEEGAACRDMLALARKYSNRVRERFDIELEPEILIVSPNPWP